MAVDFDFSDVDAAFDEFYEEAKEAMIEVGEDAVQYAKDNGDYQDHTGTLRKSNEYEVDETGLTLNLSSFSVNFNYQGRVVPFSVEIATYAGVSTTITKEGGASHPGHSGGAIQ